MKKYLVTILLLTLLIWVFSISVSAEEALKAPTLQYKIVNHDKVSLKWNKIDGAESYYIYMRNNKTGKYTKKYEVKSNAVTLKKLSPDIEYSYAVVAVKDDVKSRSSNKVAFTTPAEWYIELTYDEYAQKYISRHHYDGSEDENFKKEYDLINFIEDFYIGDWVYFQGNTNPEKHKAGVADDGYTEGDYISLYRMKNDGSKIEEILPLELCHWSGDIFYKQYGSYIVIAKNQYISHEYDKSGLYIYSINDNKVTTVIESFDMDIEDINYYNDRLYFRKDKLKWEDWYDEDGAWDGYIKTVTSSESLSVKLDGSDLKQDSLYSHIGEEINRTCYGIFGDFYYYYDSGISRVNLQNGQKEKIFEKDNDFYFKKVEFSGNYIYIEISEEYIPEYGNTRFPSIYYRVRCDGTGLTKSDKPFEWKY